MTIATRTDTTRWTLATLAAAALLASSAAGRAAAQAPPKKEAPPAPPQAREADLPKEKSLDEIIATLKKSVVEKNDPMRNRMYFELRRLGKKAVQPLAKLLSDPEPGVAEYAAFTLGWIAEPEAIDPLLKFLEGGNVEQKKAALQALGNMAWGTEPPIRKAIHQSAVPKMLAYLGDKVDIKVRREAAFGLGLAGDPRAIPELEKLVDHKDKLLSFLAKEAIDRIRETQEEEKRSGK